MLSSPSVLSGLTISSIDPDAQNCLEVSRSQRGLRHLHSRIALIGVAGCALASQETHPLTSGVWGFPYRPVTVCELLYLGQVSVSCTALS